MTTPLQAETAGDFAVFEKFGREWRVPTKRHLTHLTYMRAQANTRFGDWDMIVAEAFLSPHVSKHNQSDPDQLEALEEIDPDEESFREFSGEILTALGLGGSGNS